MKNIILMTIFSAIISGCSATPPKTIERTVYLAVPINLPNKPEIPKVPGKELACLSQEAKQKLLERDKIIKGYISDLETTIVATQKH